jgi:hypothetical protein
MEGDSKIEIECNMSSFELRFTLSLMIFNEVQPLDQWCNHGGSCLDTCVAVKNLVARSQVNLILVARSLSKLNYSRAFPK